MTATAVSAAPSVKAQAQAQDAEPPWWYAIDISLQPAPVVLGGEDMEAVDAVAQTYATQVQRPVLIVTGPPPESAQVLPVSGITGQLRVMGEFPEVERVVAGIRLRKHA